ncbi:unnamed protein product [Cuscuta campestris]|uniref:Uncharacterized protein n=1 Tax=Cuscuta campestris TaxID=132261 RepID=A0A484M155_9ASTE|nr:unnamed protein product [Cuscuta campestris]
MRSLHLVSQYASEDETEDAIPQTNEISEDELEEDNFFHEVNIIDANGVSRKKQSMKLKDVLRMREGEKIRVQMNELAQHVGAARKVLTGWMTMLVKQQNPCSPSVSNFCGVKKVSRLLLLRNVRDKFPFSNHHMVDKVLLALFSATFRNHKHNLTCKLLKDATTSLRAMLKQYLQRIGIEGVELAKLVKQHKLCDVQQVEELDILPMEVEFNEFQWLDFKNYIKSKECKDERYDTQSNDTSRNDYEYESTGNGHEAPGLQAGASNSLSLPHQL